MKTFKQFLYEATLNKMSRNTKERDTAMLSRDRGSQTEKENRSERKSLEKKLRRKGVGFSKVVLDLMMKKVMENQKPRFLIN